MPFEVKIRPVDSNPCCESLRDETVKTIAKSRFRRILEKPFSRGSLLEKVAGNGEEISNKEGFDDFEPGSVCLGKMVRNFIEDCPEKQKRCGRKWCNCCNGERTDSSDDEFDSCSCFGDLNLSSATEALENLKSLMPCVSVLERNLLADTARIVDQNKNIKRKDDVFFKVVNDGLSALGYNSSICNSHWGKSSSCPAGEYKYVDVVTEVERIIIDVDFRSEFEIARPTKRYRTILQTLPAIYVGKGDRLQKIISIVTEAAKQSLKKKGMPFPPWRKAEFIKSKWLSSYYTIAPTRKKAEALPSLINNTSGDKKFENNQFMISEKCAHLKDLLTFSEKSCPIVVKEEVKGGAKAQLSLGEKSSPVVSMDKVEGVCALTNNLNKNGRTMVEVQIEQEKIELKKSSKITGGLACIIED